jgi:hypothetical protein
MSERNRTKTQFNDIEPTNVKNFGELKCKYSLIPFRHARQIQDGRCVEMGSTTALGLVSSVTN